MKQKDKLSREECKSIQINLLEVIDKVCNENSLAYGLAYGTTLGAIRHHGFIPWDDDIDIYMLRKDYESFCEKFTQNKLDVPQWCGLLTNKNSGYYYPFAKFVDNRTIAKMDSNVTEHGVWIDIFPVDNVPEGAFFRKIFSNYCHFLRAVTIAMTTDFDSKKLGKKYYYKKILSIMATVIGKRRFANIYEKTTKKFDKKETSQKACLGGAYGIKECMPKHIFENRIRLEFEGRLFWASKDYESYLSRLYGEYMQLPSIEQRRIHSVDAWRI